MLGRVRRSSSSLESLEMERNEFSKLTKHDSLSIYEATLVKLRQGAQRKLSIEEEGMKMDMDSYSATDRPREEGMAIDTHPSPCSVLSSPSECCPPSSSSRNGRNKTMTVISMFDRYKASHNAQETPDQTVKETKD